jgi:hypothetical protein
MIQPFLDVCFFDIFRHFPPFLSACDQKFVSTTNPATKNGTFKAPIFLNPDQHVAQCTYTFLALEDERVRLEFEDFELDGTPPE